MKAKKITAVLSVAAILIIALIAMNYTYNNVPGTYDGTKTDVYQVMSDPDHAQVSDPDGIASIIVAENLRGTNAMNDVASIVFDFRGFDTLGESFILLTAIAGTFVIISRVKKNKKSEVEEENDQ